MNHTELFRIQWDDSYNDPDFAVPGTMQKWLEARDSKDIERLAEHLEFLANALRKRTAPFGWNDDKIKAVEGIIEGYCCNEVTSYQIITTDGKPEERTFKGGSHIKTGKLATAIVDSLEIDIWKICQIIDSKDIYNDDGKVCHECIKEALTPDIINVKESK